LARSRVRVLLRLRRCVFTLTGAWLFLFVVSACSRADPLEDVLRQILKMRAKDKTP